MEESSPNGLKTLWEKEKLLVTSNFSFSHSVFKRFVLQTRKNQGLLVKGIKKARIHFYTVNHFPGKELISSYRLALEATTLLEKKEMLLTSFSYFCFFKDNFMQPKTTRSISAKFNLSL